MSDERDRPMVEIRPQTVCCPAHGEHLRANWPTGFAVVSLELFTAAIATDELARAVDPSWDDSTTRPHMNEDALNQVLATRPLCYWVPREAIRRAFMESELGRLGKCKICKRRGLGGAYSLSWPEGIEQSWVCFSCMLDAGERLHRAHPDGKVWPDSDGGEQ